MPSLLQNKNFTQDYSLSTNDENLSGFSFLSHGEFTLCRDIYDFMRQNKDHVYLSMPSFEYDDIFIKRLGSMLKSPKSEIIILKKPQKNSDHFIQKLIETFNIQNETDPIKAMVREIHKLYQDNHKLIFICSGIDHFAEQDVKAIKEFCDTISEKYPTEKNNFFRFVFIGAPHEYALYKKFQNKDVQRFSASTLMPYDCMNFLSLQENTEINNDKAYEDAALALHNISAHSFATFRKMMPMYHMIASKNEEEKEKNHQFLTEIVTGDLSESEKDIFFKAQKSLSQKIYHNNHKNLILLIKTIFIIFCILSAAFIWFSMNGL